MTKKTADRVNINAGFDTLANSLDDMAHNCRQTMPLVTETLELAVSVLKMYKRAFNDTVKRKR